MFSHPSLTADLPDSTIRPRLRLLAKLPIRLVSRGRCMALALMRVTLLLAGCHYLAALANCPCRPRVLLSVTSLFFKLRSWSFCYLPKITPINERLQQLICCCVCLLPLFVSVAAWSLANGITAFAYGHEPQFYHSSI